MQPPASDLGTPTPARIVLGEIVGGHGLQGEVRVRVTGDSGDNLLASKSVWLAREPDAPDARAATVRGGGPGRGGELRIRLAGVDDRDAADALKGLRILVDIASLPPLPAGEFYWHELVGCEVASEAGQLIGRVQEIWETGAHDVLLVVDERGVRRLVPTAEALLKSIDPVGRRIVVVDLPGLFDPV